MTIRQTLAFASLFLVAVSCRHAHPYDSSNPSPDGVKIDEFSINTTLLTASETYFGATDSVQGDTYLTLTASILWPQKVSGQDIRPLQDSILSAAFPASESSDPRRAIREYVTDVAAYELGKMEKIEKVKKVSDKVNSYFSKIIGRLLEVNEQTCTYLLSFSEYLGGAHPNYASVVMSYDFTTGTCIDYNYLFKPGAETELQPLIMQSLAESRGMTVEELGRDLIDSLPVTPDVYVLNGMLVFHYNPYEILPFSFGTIDVDVTPYQVKDYLTPEAYELLIEN